VNNVEGTRQNNPVTLGERESKRIKKNYKMFFKNLFGIKKEEATV